MGVEKGSEDSKNTTVLRYPKTRNDCNVLVHRLYET